jgi:hypothetical protein
MYRNNVVHLARQELEGVKDYLHHENSKVLKRLDHLGKFNILQNSRIGSVDQARDDMRRDVVEEWCRRRGRRAGTKSLTMSETRTLRKWFMKMDADGSGEVSVDELQEPLLSCGVVRSKAEIRQMFRNAGLDDTGEVGFNDLMKAINKMRDAKKKKLSNLQNMCNDPIMSMETLLSEERRRLLLHGVVNEAEVRQSKVEQILAQQVVNTNPRKLAELELALKDHEEAMIDHNDLVSAMSTAMAEKLSILRRRRQIAASRKAASEPLGGHDSPVAASHRGRFGFEFSELEFDVEGEDDDSLDASTNPFDIYRR